jgi:hypothetical protein
MAPSASSSLQLQPSSLDRLRKFASGGYLYALLDAYEAPAVPAKVQELGKEKAVSLFIGNAERKYWDLAPYLIVVEEGTLDWMARTVWKAPCGVLVLSKSGLETLRTHFRRFLTVQLPDGERWYFRYYDPRILHTYLENCRPDELEIFFGPVRGFGIMDPESDRVALLHSSGEGRPAMESQAGLTSLWKVRPEQYQALGEASWKDLEDRMVLHMIRRFPQYCQQIGEDSLRKLIRYGTAKAATYQLAREADLCQFVELVIGMGRDFDQNPEIGAALTDPSVADPGLRLARVWELAKQMAGPAQAGRKSAP